MIRTVQNVLLAATGSGSLTFGPFPPGDWFEHLHIVAGLESTPASKGLLEVAFGASGLKDDGQLGQMFAIHAPLGRANINCGLLLDTWLPVWQRMTRDGNCIKVNLTSTSFESAFYVTVGCSVRPQFKIGGGKRGDVGSSLIVRPS